MTWALLPDYLIQVWRLPVWGVGHLTVSEPQARGCGQDVATRSSAIQFLAVHPAYNHQNDRPDKEELMMSNNNLSSVAEFECLELLSMSYE